MSCSSRCVLRAYRNGGAPRQPALRFHTCCPKNCPACSSDESAARRTSPERNRTFWKRKRWFSRVESSKGKRLWWSACRVSADLTSNVEMLHSFPPPQVGSLQTWRQRLAQEAHPQLQQPCFEQSIANGLLRCQASRICVRRAREHRAEEYVKRWPRGSPTMVVCAARRTLPATSRSWPRSAI